MLVKMLARCGNRDARLTHFQGRALVLVLEELEALVAGIHGIHGRAEGPQVQMSRLPVVNGGCTRTRALRRVIGAQGLDDPVI